MRLGGLATLAKKTRIVKERQTDSLQRIFIRVTFLYPIVNKRVKCDFAGDPSGYKPLTMGKSST
jgi:hypothetical protein